MTYKGYKIEEKIVRRGCSRCKKRKSNIELFKDGKLVKSWQFSSQAEKEQMILKAKKYADEHPD